MFGFGKKKKKYFTSRVLMTREALNQTLIAGIRSGTMMPVVFFSSTQKALLKELGDDPVLAECIILAGQHISPAAIQKIRDFSGVGAYRPVLGERYPLSEKEKQLATALETNGMALPIAAYAALDDAMMLRAGGEKTKSLMERMGMKEDEVIEHAMIESSIERLQSKIAEKITVESHTQSAQDWFNLNIPG